jgi:hypothetical protein
VFAAMIVAVTKVGISRFLFVGSEWFLSTAVVDEQLDTTAEPDSWKRRDRLKAARAVIVLAAHRVGADRNSALVLLGVNAGGEIGKGVSEKERIKCAARLAGNDDATYWYRTYASTLIEAIAHETYLLVSMPERTE